MFSHSEYEVLGVPGLSKSNNHIADQDLGRYALYPIAEYKRAFKTPTVRNAAQTGPYMHNGRYKSLTEVLVFYNRGGGAGLGLQTPEQTLSTQPLHLSSHEIGEIVRFLQALTDDLKPEARHRRLGT